MENVWSFVKETGKAKEPDKKAQLKNIITTVWREINKPLCRRLNESNPARLEAVIVKQGRQVKKKDHQMAKEE